jgi:dedicated sortase system histidine kinase
MSLRKQLLALGALTLLLPWAGLRLVQQVEASLRLALEGSLLDSARARIVATQLAESDALSRRGIVTSGIGEPLFVHSLSKPPLIDGFRDWDYARDASGTAAESSALHLAGGSRLWLGINSGFLYLFVDVVDDEVVYQAAPGTTPHGDRVALVFANEADELNALLLANSAPGGFRAQPTEGGPIFAPSGGYYDAARGAWQNTSNGYSIEARLPIRLVGEALGVGIIDSFDDGESAELAASTWSGTAAANPLVLESTELNLKLRPFSGGDDRLRVIDANGWVIADSGPFASTPSADQANRPTVMERFFRYVLRRDDPEYQSQQDQLSYIADPALRAVLDGREATVWYRQGAEVSAIVVAAVPVDPEDPRRGAVLLEQASDPIRSLTNQAMMQVLSMTVLIILIAVPGLLGYAGYLSFRVRRLARAAESALGPRGEINVKVPGTKARDEIGDLSRAFTDLLGRLRDYTDYLQSLKSKLSHELRTPLAIVATSLDNLEHEASSDPAREYLVRLRHGTERLESILQAMTAATRVEQAITQVQPERFNLVDVIESCVSSYEAIYPDQTFEASLPAEPVPIDGSPELIEQMLDKLIDNAAGFAVEGSIIEVNLELVSRKAKLSVVNRGPLLPEAMRHQLFDSLVSVRKAGGDRAYLGLGLYIVTLVVELHHGQVDAENLEDGSGVRISVVLPRADAGTA